MMAKRGDTYWLILFLKEFVYGTSTFIELSTFTTELINKITSFNP